MAQRGGRPPADRTVGEHGEDNAAALRRAPVSRRTLLAGAGASAKAMLEGLRPGTTYHYRQRLSDGTVTGDAHSTTAPARRHAGTADPVPAPFTFTAFADVGTNAGTFRNAYAGPAGRPR